MTLRKPGEGLSFAIVDDIYTFRATDENTAGRYAWWETIVFLGEGPPPHVHRRQEEDFLAGR